MSADLQSISVAGAKLPQAYENAKTALSECNKIDECQAWADKAEALASYARQAEDESLRRMADRIQARAIRRAGELLKQIDRPEQGGRPKQNGEGAPTVSRKQVATDAGMSDHQRTQALRVASVPEEHFDQAVESDDPPTVTKLAERGTKKVTDHLQGHDPKQYYAATHTVGAMRRFAQKCQDNDPAFVAGGVLPKEVSEAKALVAELDAWLDVFVTNLEDKA